MKKYSRKGLIAFFSRMPPNSRPCKSNEDWGGSVCPIATYLGMTPSPDEDALEVSARAMEFDPHLVDAIDGPNDDYRWERLTASRIVKIAKAVSEKEKETP